MKSFKHIISATVVICALFAFSSSSIAQTIYHYADGSGNTYTLNDHDLSYDPVTPEESSSGTYSGGEAKQVTVSDAELKGIYAAFRDASKNTSAHAENRAKGTGLLKIEKAGANKTIYILKAGSKEMTALQVVLEKAIK